MEDVLIRTSPDVVLVEGDTNTVLGAALAAAKLHIRVGHVEAGLRSGDRRMPEELNRVVVDHLSDYLFAPTSEAADNLRREGIEGPKVLVTGNTVVDAVEQNRPLACEHGAPLETFGVTEGSYFLATLHRQENVDDPTRLHGLFQGLRGVAERNHMPVLLPLHPRTGIRLQEAQVATDGIRFLEPLDYFTFLRLESSATLVLTDSGGVQEEACILGVPCVTLRDTTERPETVAVGANVLAGADPHDILTCAERMLTVDRHWPNPFGDGHAAERIIHHLIGG
jgi:UDP-N-acetylglucosamine 2-epimerase (non-hydrolysing)